MPRISRAFHLDKSQAELDFVDVPSNRDVPLFIDPFAISQRVDRWSLSCRTTLIGFFQRIVDEIRGSHLQEARSLLQNLGEPNETRLGLSKGVPSGAGIGPDQAEQLFRALRDSTAVQTGFITSLEECELMIEGISYDKISDLTTNVIRKHLIEYTQDQCGLLGIPLHQVALPSFWDSDSQTWVTSHANVPVVHGRPLVLVPKAIVRYRPAYQHQQYYNHFVLNYLRGEELSAGSSLVRALQNGKRVVYKKDLKSKYPLSKAFLYDFSKEHPEVLADYKQFLAEREKSVESPETDETERNALATALSQALRSIPVGQEHADRYHKLVIGAVEFVFFPHLLYPKGEQRIHQGRKRIDISMENGATTGIFHRLHAVRGLPCSYVVFECKNYATDVANPELDQLAGRFSTNRGKVGFMCCRRFEDRTLFLDRCKDTMADGRGLIIPLDDDFLLRLLTLSGDRRNAELDEALSRAVTEVWAG